MQIKTYAVIDYYDQPIDFVNKFYFNARINDGKRYSIIVEIITITIPLPIALGILLFFLTLLYFHPILASFMEWLLEVKYSHAVESEINVNYKDLTCGLFKIKLIKNHRILWNMHVPALIVFNLAVTVALTVFTGISFSRLHEYGKEVLCHRDGCGDGSDHHDYVMLFYVFSSVSIFVAISAITVWPIILFCANKFSRREFLISFTASLISANFMFIGIYFLPYMLLSFVNDPLQTTSAYVMVAALTICGYLTCFSLVTVVNYPFLSYCWQLSCALDTSVLF